MHIDRHTERIKTASFFLAAIGSGFSVSLCGLGLAGYYAAWVIHAIKYPQPKVNLPHKRWIIALFLSLLVSVFISDFLFLSLKGLFKYVQSFLLFYAALDFFKSRKQFTWIIVLFLFLWVIAGLAAVSQDVFGEDFINHRPAIHYKILEQRNDEVVSAILRVTGSFKHSNDFATFILPGIFLFVTMGFIHWRRKENGKLVLDAAALSILAYALTRSMSRSAFLSLLGAAVLICLFSKRRMLYLGSMAAGVGLILAIPSDLSTRLRELFDLSSGTMPERIILLQTTAKMMAASPIFGLGLNTYSKHFSRFRPPEYSDEMYTHNSYLQMSSEAGLLGLLLYMVIILMILMKFIHVIRRAKPSDTRLLAMGILAGLMGFLINCFFESCLQSTQLRTFFWILLGIAAAMSRNRLWEKES